MHTRRCVIIVLRRIRTSMRNEADKAVQRQRESRLKWRLLSWKIVQMGCLNWKRIDSKEVEGGRCIKGSDGKLCFSDKERYGKDHE